MNGLFLARRAGALVALGVVATLLGCGGSGGLPSPRHPLTRAPDEPFRRVPPPTPDAPPLRAPAMSQVELPNGLTMMVIPRPGWPTVSVAIVTRASELDYEEGALELATAYVARATMIRQPDTSLSFGAALSGAGIAGTAQTRDLEGVLGALADAIHGPLGTEAMHQARAELLRGEEMSSTSPLGIGRTYATDAIYTPNPTFGALHRQRYRAVANISPPMVSVVARDAFRPRETAVLLVGDITPERARALVEPRFGAAYAERVLQRRALAPVNPGTVAFGVQSMRSSQLQLVYGLPSPDLDAPDWAAYQVLEAVLAGGFTSSLNTRIRHELGASYGVRWGAWISAPGRAAFIEARLDADQAVPALAAFFAELVRVRSAPLSEAELSRARRVVWGEWETSFATPSGLLSVCERAFVARLSVDELAARINATRQVTASAVLAVARERLDPARNVVVLTGPIEALRGHQIVRNTDGFVLRAMP